MTMLRSMTPRSLTLRRLLAACLFSLALTIGAAAQPPAPQQPAPQSAPQPQDEFVPVESLPPSEQLPAAPLLIAAYAFAWLAIGAYVLSVARRLTSVQHEIERLEGDLRRTR